MQTKLEAINGIEELGVTKIWELIVGIYQTSNPGFIRRHKCYELKSEFSDRLILEFEESEMSKAKILVVLRVQSNCVTEHPNFR